MRKILKQEEYRSWDIEFQKENDGTVRAFGYNGGVRTSSRPELIGTGSTKAEAFDQAKAYIRKHDEEIKKSLPSYYQYRNRSINMNKQAKQYKGISILFERIPKDNIAVFKSFYEARTPQGVYLGYGYTKSEAFADAKNKINESGTDNLRIKNLKNQIINDVNLYGKIKDRALVKELLRKHNFTNKQLQNFDWRNDLSYKTSADEYIDIKCRASVWASYVDGSITILGKKYYAKTQYKTKVTGL